MGTRHSYVWKIIEDRRDEALLRAEVVVDGRVVRRPGFDRDLAERDAVDAVPREEPLRGDHEAERAPNGNHGEWFERGVECQAAHGEVKLRSVLTCCKRSRLLTGTRGAGSGG